MGVFSDTADLIKGKAPKAMIFVQKRSASSVPGLQGEDAKNAINESVAALKALAKKKKAGKVSSRMGKAAGQVMDVDTLGELFEADAAQMKETETNMAEKNFLKMEVQYNPNSLTFSTAAGRQRDFRAMGDAGAQQLVTMERKATTFMSVQLVFEDVNSQDAFIRENLNPNIGNVKDMAANLITKAAGGYSIKEKVEGLISLLISNRTRNMVFVWADMFFHGQLNSVDANYTMFNKKGEPIKATVNLSLRQAASSQGYATDNEYWDEAFKAAFVDRSMGGNLANVGENVSEEVSDAVGNLLS